MDIACWKCTLKVLQFDNEKDVKPLTHLQSVKLSYQMKLRCIQSVSAFMDLISFIITSEI